MSSIDTFVSQENTLNGRGAYGLAVEYNAVGSASVGSNLGKIIPPTGENAVIGFESATFTDGYDVVLLDGQRSDYEIQVNASGVTTITDIGADDATVGQTVTVSGESYILFNGAHISVSDPATPAALTVPPDTSASPTGVLNYPNDIYFVMTQANAQLAQFYEATLPWEPQPSLAGFEYWENALANGMSLGSIAQSFINTSYFQATYGAALGSTHAAHLAYVELLYQNILGEILGATNDGVQYWTSDLDNGTLNAAQMLISFTNATSTSSLLNAVPGTTAGAGSGWLINYALTGGYADPGAKEAASTVFTAADQTGVLNTGLINTAALASDYVASDGDSVGPLPAGVTNPGYAISTNTANTTVILSASINDVDVGASGENIVGSTTGGSLIVVESSNTNIFLHGTSNQIYSAFFPVTSLNNTITNYIPGSDILMITSNLIANPVILDPTSAAPVQGSSLNFTYPTGNSYYIDVGTLTDSSAATMAAAANAVYVVADTPTATSPLANIEHIVFYGQVGSDTVLYVWGTRGTGGLYQGDYPGANIDGNHKVNGDEFSFEITLLGVQASALSVKDFPFQ